MRRATFPDGGFVLHHVLNVVNNSVVSAWYSPEGTLEDAEYMPLSSPGHFRTLPNTWTNVRNHLALLGRVWRNAPTEQEKRA